MTLPAMLSLAVLATSAAPVWVLTCLAFVLLVLAAMVVKDPTLVSKGQDAAGKGMAVGCTMLLLVSATTVTGIIATVLAWHGELPVITRIAAMAPLAVVVIVLGTTFVVAQLESARREQAAHAARMAIPIFLLVDSADEGLTAMYDALRSRYPLTEMQLRPPAALHWQLGEHVPRARIICLNADLPSQPDAIGLTNDSRMAVDDLASCRPVCPILLFSSEPESARPMAQRLIDQGWNVRLIPRTGADWYKTEFLMSAVDLLGSFTETPHRGPGAP